MKAKKRLQLADFDDYRLFLTSLCKEEGYGFKAQLASVIQIRSSYLTAVLNKKTHLSLEQGERLSFFLKLNELECDYFLLLLQEARAGSLRLENYFKQKRKQLQQRLQGASAEHVKHQLSEKELRAFYYSNSINCVIHMLAVLDQGLSKNDIIQKLSFFAPYVEKAIDQLIEHGFLFLEKNLLKSHRNLLMLQRDDPEIWNYHLQMRSFAQSILLRSNMDDLAYSSVLTFSPKDINKVKTILRNSIRQINNSTLENYDSKNIYVLNIDFLGVC